MVGWPYNKSGPAAGARKESRWRARACEQAGDANLGSLR